MRASWFSAAAALCLAAAPAPAQRPVVFVHGIFMDASEWANSANYIKYNLGLAIDPIVPTLGWRLRYEDQATNLANAVAGRSNVVAVSHSNGGIVTRQYGRSSGSGSHITGHIAVGSLHQGAPLVASIRNGLLGAYMQGLAASLADPISYYRTWDRSYDDRWTTNCDNYTTDDCDDVILLGSMDDILDQFRDQAYLVALSDATADVLPEMCPPSSDPSYCPGGGFIGDLNSETSQLAERQAFQERISITTDVPSQYVWAHLCSFCWDHRGIPSVIAEIAEGFAYHYSHSDNPVLSQGAYRWDNLAYQMRALDANWLYLIGAQVYFFDPDNGTVFADPTDGLLPVSTQTYVGGTLSLNLHNIAHGEQPGNTQVLQAVRDVLRDHFGISNSALSVTISGPTSLPTSGTYAWTANPSGASPDYTYQWQYQNQGSSTWTSLGTGQSQSLQVDAGGFNFTIRVTVTSDGQVGSAALSVTAPPPIAYIDIGGPGMISAKGTYQFPTTLTNFQGQPSYTWYSRNCYDASEASCESWYLEPFTNSTFVQMLSHDCGGSGEKNYQLHVVAVYGNQSAEAYHRTWLCEIGP